MMLDMKCMSMASTLEWRKEEMVMKKLKLFTLVPLLISAMMGCTTNNSHTPNDNFIYSEPVYEPLNLAKNDHTIMRMELLGTYGGVKAAAWDDYDIKIRCWYDDDTLYDYPFKVVNVPLHLRHYLGEVGHHELNLFELKYVNTLDFEIIKNPDWDGFKCEFFDRDKNYLTTEKVGFWETAEYKGKELPQVIDDEYNQYRFIGWNHSLEYIHQDMQFIAAYKQVEKRFYAIRPFNRDYHNISVIVEDDGRRGSTLMYLGRVKRVAFFYTDVQEFNQDELVFKMDYLSDYAKYWNEYNNAIVNNCIIYESDSQYAPHFRNSGFQLVAAPEFAMEFDARYKYKDSIKVLLEDGSEIKTSKDNPYETVVRETASQITTAFDFRVPVGSAIGFYRLALVCDFDVHLSVSFERLANDKYMISNYNYFIMSPVMETSRRVFQYSEDGDFNSNFETKLKVTSKGLYYAADAIDWNNVK